MSKEQTDFTQSLEELTGLLASDSETAPTYMVELFIRACKKPLNRLSDEDIGRFVVQHYGYPFILDLVWPKLEADPLYDGGYYPGAVLSNLIRADADIWHGRPHYRNQLDRLYQRALERPLYEIESFRESLGLPESSSPTN